MSLFMTRSFVGGEGLSSGVEASDDRRPSFSPVNMASI